MALTREQEREARDRVEAAFPAAFVWTGFPSLRGGFEVFIVRGWESREDFDRDDHTGELAVVQFIVDAGEVSG
jgi:hypothetical protein